MCLVRMIEIWKTHLFRWKEKWDDGKWSWYEFTILSLLNKTKLRHFFN